MDHGPASDATSWLVPTTALAMECAPMVLASAMPYIRVKTVLSGPVSQNAAAMANAVSDTSAVPMCQRRTRPSTLWSTSWESVRKNEAILNT